MQLAALGTGSPLKGALSMLFFSLGTVPLMLGLGGLVALLGQRFARTVNLAGVVLVAMFGVAMLSQGAALSGMIDSFQLWAVLLSLSLLGLVALAPGGKLLRRGLSIAVLTALWYSHSPCTEHQQHEKQTAASGSRMAYSWCIVRWRLGAIRISQCRREFRCVGRYRLRRRASTGAIIRWSFPGWI